MHPAVVLAHEVVELPGAPPVPRVEEPLLEEAEGALRPGVIRAPALARHALDQPVPPADSVLSSWGTPLRRFLWSI